MRRFFTTGNGRVAGIAAIVAVLALTEFASPQGIARHGPLSQHGDLTDPGDGAGIHDVIYRGTDITREPLKHFPGFVTIIDSIDLDGEKSYCTGALIASDVILTAGHCLTKSRTVSVRVITPTGPKKYATVSAKTWSVHPNVNGGYSGAPMQHYDKKTAHRFADLGLIVLSEPVADVEPVIFAPPDFDPAGSTAQMFAFGHGRDANLRLNGNLEYADLHVTEQIAGTAQYVATLKSGQGWCKRDSGGPITLGVEGDDGRSRHYLLGVGFGFFNDLKLDDRPELTRIWGDPSKIPGCGSRVGYLLAASQTRWIETALRQMLPGEARYLQFY